MAAELPLVLMSSFNYFIGDVLFHCFDQEISYNKTSRNVLTFITREIRSSNGSSRKVGESLHQKWWQLIIIISEEEKTGSEIIHVTHLSC